MNAACFMLLNVRRLLYAAKIILDFSDLLFQSIKKYNYEKKVNLLQVA